MTAFAVIVGAVVIFVAGVHVGRVQLRGDWIAGRKAKSGGAPANAAMADGLAAVFRARIEIENACRRACGVNSPT